MSRSRSIRLVALAAGSLAALSLVASTAIGIGRAMAAPTVVVSVDVPRLLSELKVREQAEAQLRTQAEKFEAEQKTLSSEIEALSKQLQAIPAANEDERWSMEETIAEKLIHLRGLNAFHNEQLDIEKALQLRQMDTLIREAIAEVAELNGYDLVITNDTALDLSVNPNAQASRESQIQRRITSRRVLFARPGADITEELIQRMNR